MPGSLERRLAGIEKTNKELYQAKIKKVYIPVFDRFANSLTIEQKRYVGLTLMDRLPVEQASPLMDWTIESKLYQAFADMGVKVPNEILGELGKVEEELDLHPTADTPPLDRIKKIVAYLEREVNSEG